MKIFYSLACVGLLLGGNCAALPALPAMPEIARSMPVDSVPMGNSKSAPKVKLDLPIASGPFAPTWASIEKNYPGTPDWLREAKFGIWVHFGPQASGQSGDWYARKMYVPGTTAYDLQNRVIAAGKWMGLAFKPPWVTSCQPFNFS